MDDYGIKKTFKKSDDNGGFQRESSQWLVNGSKHMNSQNDCWMMQLKAIYLKGILLCWELKTLQRYDVNILYFAPLQFSKQEWSIAPWIINIIERGLTWLIALFGWNWVKTK